METTNQIRTGGWLELFFFSHFFKAVLDGPSAAGTPEPGWQEPLLVERFAKDKFCPQCDRSWKLGGLMWIIHD